MITRCSAPAPNLVRRLSTVTHQAVLRQTVQEHLTDEYIASVQSGGLRSPDSLARFLAKRIVAFGEHFLVIDKPATLSVWGHSKQKEKAFGYCEKQSPATDLCLSLRDCLPQLRNLLIEEYGLWSAGVILSPQAAQTQLNCGVFLTKKDRLDRFPPPHELLIVEALPSAYSGLILLATSPEYCAFAKKFYANASRNQFPGSIYQSLLAVCWGHPTRGSSHLEQLHLSVHKSSDLCSVSYRPPDDEISARAASLGRVLTKQVSHSTVALSESNKACMVLVSCNSVYAGLPELFLLHEGCEVIGEELQASRLVNDRVTPMVLPPASARFGSRLPPRLCKILGLSAGTNARSVLRGQLPMHMHRCELLLPPVLPISSGNTTTTTFSYHGSRRPLAHRGRIKICSRGVAEEEGIVNQLTNQSLLTWREFGSMQFLIARSPRLPAHFNYTMSRLGVNFSLVDMYRTRDSVTI